jgi:hypothetical protein
MMKRSKKDIQVIKGVKRALDAALADGTISKAVYDLINRPGLETRNKGSSWEDRLLVPEPEPEVIPALEPEPELELEVIPVPKIAALEPEAEGIPTRNPSNNTDYDSLRSTQGCTNTATLTRAEPNHDCLTMIV